MSLENSFSECRVDLSNIAEKTSLLSQQAFNSVINLNQLKVSDAINSYRDMKAVLKNLQEMIADFDRKVQSGSDSNPQ